MQNIAIIDKFRNLSTKQKLTIILSSIITITLIVVIVSLCILIPRSMEPHDSGPGDEYYEPTAYFINRHTLDYSIPGLMAAKVINNIERVVINEDELKSAPSENKPPKNYESNFYGTEIVETSIRKIPGAPKFSYQVDVNISDGRTYRVYLRFDEQNGKDYLITIIDRTDSAKQADNIFIESDNSNFDDMLKDWANNFNLTSPIYTKLPMTETY